MTKFTIQKLRSGMTKGVTNLLKSEGSCHVFVSKKWYSTKLIFFN